MQPPHAVNDCAVDMPCRALLHLAHRPLLCVCCPLLSCCLTSMGSSAVPSCAVSPGPEGSHALLQPRAEGWDQSTPWYLRQHSSKMQHTTAQHSMAQHKAAQRRMMPKEEE